MRVTPTRATISAVRNSIGVKKGSVLTSHVPELMTEVAVKRAFRRILIQGSKELYLGMRKEEDRHRLTLLLLGIEILERKGNVSLSCVTNELYNYTRRAQMF